MSLYKAASKVAGHGIFTDTLIKKGTKVFTLADTKASMAATHWRVYIAGSHKADDPLQISRYEYIDLEPFSRTFNHSCDPNCGISGISDLVAIKDIEAGKEITYDYATTVSPEDSWWAMSCSCGAVICRKTIVPPDRLPEAVFNHYQSLGILPDHAKIKAWPLNRSWLTYYALKAIGLMTLRR